MQAYRHVLVALDFSESATFVCEHGKDLADRYGADLTLVHVVESLPVVDSTYGPVMPFEIDLTDQMLDAARSRMDQAGQAFGVPEDRRLVELGSPKTEIVRIAQERAIDLIVVGSHGRHGVKLLLGSTATSVIHHARCDVLAVRLKDR
ncbi:universal stress protein [Methylotetracoccus oryzae]|uniref:universal stress protein n=1 Tax=Methylotetracoccus oryzae TaxID=1919059 RepID=UPI00111880FB|nr:universal stress protein [Methylotetracoccus oryzae]